MFSAFSHMLPSFAVRNIEKLDEYEVVSNIGSIDYDVRSISDDTFSSWSQSSDNGTLAAEWRYGSAFGPDGERLPSWHFDSCVWVDPWDLAHTAEEQEEINACSLPLRVINAMGHAGRGDAEHAFRDFRYDHRTRQRERRNAEKYWKHRIVSKGAVEAVREKHPETVSKREMYDQAQAWPRPRAWKRPNAHKNRMSCGCIVMAKQDSKRARRPDCEVPPRYDIDEFDLWVMRWEIATETPGQDTEARQLSLLDFVKDRPG